MNRRKHLLAVVQLLFFTAIKFESVDCKTESCSGSGVVSLTPMRTTEEEAFFVSQGDCLDGSYTLLRHKSRLVHAHSENPLVLEYIGGRFKGLHPVEGGKAIQIQPASAFIVMNGEVRSKDRLIQPRCVHPTPGSSLVYNYERLDVTPTGNGCPNSASMDWRSVACNYIDKYSFKGNDQLILGEPCPAALHTVPELVDLFRIDGEDRAALVLKSAVCKLDCTKNGTKLPSNPNGDSGPVSTDYDYNSPGVAVPIDRLIDPVVIGVGSSIDAHVMDKINQSYYKRLIFYDYMEVQENGVGIEGIHSGNEDIHGESGHPTNQNHNPSDYDPFNSYRAPGAETKIGSPDKDAPKLPNKKCKNKGSPEPMSPQQAEVPPKKLRPPPTPAPEIYDASRNSYWANVLKRPKPAGKDGVRLRNRNTRRGD